MKRACLFAFYKDAVFFDKFILGAGDQEVTALYIEFSSNGKIIYDHFDYYAADIHTLKDTYIETLGEDPDPIKIWKEYCE